MSGLVKRSKNIYILNIANEKGQFLTQEKRKELYKEKRNNYIMLPGLSANNIGIVTLMPAQI